MNVLEESPLGELNKIFGVSLLVLLVSGLSISFSLLPTGATIVDPMEKYSKFRVPVTTLWGFLAFFPTYSLFTSKTEVTGQRIVRSDLIRIGLGRITMTKQEYMLILGAMKKWDVDIAELCRYCVMSIIEAHSGEKCD